jgi:hypothetical protein
MTAARGHAAEQMREEIFLRHSLQDREWKSGKKNFLEAEQFFCVFNVLGTKKTFLHQQSFVPGFVLSTAIPYKLMRAH